MDIPSHIQPGPTPAATAGNGASAATSDAADAIASDFDTFLRLLTAQLNNQDPLNPVSSEDYASQLAQFSGVEQQVKTNDLLEEMVAQMNVTGIADLAGWVGLDARVPEFGYFDGTPIDLTLPDIAARADGAQLVVYSEGGIELDRITLPVDQSTFQWSGASSTGAPFLDGIYKFEVESYQGGVLTDTQPAESYVRVNEVRIENGAAVLVLEGGAKVLPGDVTGISNPTAT